MTPFKVRKRLKVFLPSFLALSILVIGILANTPVLNEFSGYPPLVRSISQKIDLKDAEVADIFGNDSDEVEAERYAKFADKLDDLVIAGKITEKQKGKLLDSYDPLWA